MRTTLNLDDDILGAAHELAKRQKRTAGQVISDLVRQALNTSNAALPADEPFLGFRPFPSRGVLVTNDVVNQLREEGEY
jgi:predicted transcriptional regulator